MMMRGVDPNFEENAERDYDECEAKFQPKDKEPPPFKLMENEPVELAKVLRFRPFEQARIEFVCKIGGFLLIKPPDNIMARHRFRAANGIVEEKPDVPFEIIVSNFGSKPVDLPKGLNICLLYTSPSPRDLSTSRMPSSA